MEKIIIINTIIRHAASLYEMSQHCGDIFHRTGVFVTSLQVPISSPFYQRLFPVAGFEQRHNSIKHFPEVAQLYCVGARSSGDRV